MLQFYMCSCCLIATLKLSQSDSTTLPMLDLNAYVNYEEDRAASQLEMHRLLMLFLGIAIQCKRKDEFIAAMETLPDEIQEDIMENYRTVSLSAFFPTSSEEDSGLAIWSVWTAAEARTGGAGLRKCCRRPRWTALRSTEARRGGEVLPGELWCCTAQELLSRSPSRASFANRHHLVAAVESGRRCLSYWTPPISARTSWPAQLEAKTAEAVKLNEKLRRQKDKVQASEKATAAKVKPHQTAHGNSQLVEGPAALVEDSCNQQPAARRRDDHSSACRMQCAATKLGRTARADPNVAPGDWRAPHQLGGEQAVPEFGELEAEVDRCAPLVQLDGRKRGPSATRQAGAMKFLEVKGAGADQARTWLRRATARDGRAAGQAREAQLETATKGGGGQGSTSWWARGSRPRSTEGYEGDEGTAEAELAEMEVMLQSAELTSQSCDKLKIGGVQNLHYLTRRTERLLQENAGSCAKTKAADSTAAGRWEPVAAGQAGPSIFSGRTPSIEIVAAEQAEVQRRLPQAQPVGVRVLSDGSRLVVANMRIQSRHQHQRLRHQLGYTRSAKADGGVLGASSSGARCERSALVHVELQVALAAPIVTATPQRGPEPSRRKSLASLVSEQAVVLSEPLSSTSASWLASASNLRDATGAGPFVPHLNGRPVRRASAAATSSPNPGQLFSPVPTAVPPMASWWTSTKLASIRRRSQSSWYTKAPNSWPTVSGVASCRASRSRFNEGSNRPAASMATDTCIAGEVPVELAGDHLVRGAADGRLDGRVKAMLTVHSGGRFLHVGQATNHL
uniref:HOOK_N domain-containing protein n=1 Tax=Macrostomum lignano TaxID=282301 RepID=A0A1I8JR91_9PLAT